MHNQYFRSIIVADLKDEVEELYRNASLYHKQIRNAVTELLKERIEGFNERLPTIMSLGNPVMKDRHWESVFKVLGKRYMSGQTFTLSQLVELKIYTFEEKWFVVGFDCFRVRAKVGLLLTEGCY